MALVVLCELKIEIGPKYTLDMMNAYWTVFTGPNILKTLYFNITDPWHSLSLYLSYSQTGWFFYINQIISRDYIITQVRFNDRLKIENRLIFYNYEKSYFCWTDYIRRSTDQKEYMSVGVGIQAYQKCYYYECRWIEKNKKKNSPLHGGEKKIFSNYILHNIM